MDATLGSRICKESNIKDFLELDIATAWTTSFAQVARNRHNRLSIFRCDGNSPQDTLNLF
jgi:hypothetical protein